MSTSGNRTGTHPLGGPVPADAISVCYDERGLDNWSDQRLVAAVAEVIATPRVEAADSFILHSPLELAARRRLLQLLQPSARRTARLHMLAIAADYEAHGPGLEPARWEQPQPALSQQPHSLDTPPLETLAGELLAAVDAGDLVAVDEAGLRLEASAPDPAALAGALAGPLLVRTAAAAHAPIFLRYLRNAGRDGAAMRSMLRPLARELARRPEWRVGWFSDPDVAPFGAGDMQRALATAPRLGVPGSSFIHPTMMQVDAPDVAPVVLGPVLGGDPAAVARDILRTAAQSMLEDAPEHGPYGWTHCLSLPQAALAMSDHLANPSDGLAMAATHVLGFRSAQSERDLPPFRPAEPQGRDQVLSRVTALATEASTRHDAHVVKYCLAVIEAANDDPEATDLYLSAGERLLAIWDDMGGNPKDAVDQR